MNKKESYLFSQVIPLICTVIICSILIVLLAGIIHLLNRFTGTDIQMKMRLRDIGIGATIYLKTSVDFAIFIGNLMGVFKGWKNRIMIELGTAIGNATGTFLILGIWDFFRDVKILLAAMILLAALVLFKLAEEGLEHAHYDVGSSQPGWFSSVVNNFQKLLHVTNAYVGKPLEYIMPNLSMRPNPQSSLTGVFFLSFTIPFILGLDDFAGYVPMFSIVNVYGFATGVIVGHMILNIFLFIRPHDTILIVKHPVISLLGSMAFVGLGLWGLREVIVILLFH